MSMRARWLPAAMAGLSALSAAGCGGIAAPASPVVRLVGSQAMGGQPISTAARRAAEAVANRILASAVVPPGARPVAQLPGAVLSEPEMTPLCRPFVDSSRSYRVPQGPAAVTSFLLGHAPHSMPGRGAHGTGTDRGVPSSWFVEDFGTQSGRELVFTFAKAGQGTGLRVDALTVPSGAWCANPGAPEVVLHR